MAVRVVGDESQQVRHRGGAAQIQTDHGQPGRGDVDVAVDECRSDEAAVEIDDVGVGELRAPDVVGAEPHHDPVRRTAIAVASGMAGLCTRPLASSVVKLVGVARKVGRFRLGHVIRHVQHLAVDVVTAAGPERWSARARGCP